eukprot:jgi/Mesen1/1789/ME000014S01206
MYKSPELSCMFSPGKDASSSGILAPASERPENSARGLVRKYDCSELGTIPLGVQLMGSNPEMIGIVTRMLIAAKGAPRVDLNCGCPANNVTGKGSGSSLLKTPARLRDVVAAMSAAAALCGRGAPVTVKMRRGWAGLVGAARLLCSACTLPYRGGFGIWGQSTGIGVGLVDSALWPLAGSCPLHAAPGRDVAWQGKGVSLVDFEDTGLLRDNLLAVQEGGAAFVTLHPRTKVGNGDVTSVEAARALVSETGCDGVMIGRGAVQDPFIFHRIKASYCGTRGELQDGPEVVLAFLLSLVPDLELACAPGSNARARGVVCKRLKQTVKYLFQSNDNLREHTTKVLRISDDTPAALWAATEEYVTKYWTSEVEAHSVQSR